MCEKNRFFVCAHCGNIIGMINSSGVPVSCCGEPMKQLEPGTVDASLEKHVPVVSVKCKTVTVNVGEVTHPMTDEHYIMWVYLETTKGGQRKCLSPGDDPTVTFKLGDEKAVAVYAYCNLHGLWKTDI